MFLVKIEQEKFLFKQESVGNYFYIIKSGSLDLIINEKYVKTFTSGDCFRELALLQGALRSGSIKAKEKCFLWCLDRSKFRYLVNQVNKLLYEENKKFLDSVNLLSN